MGPDGNPLYLGGLAGLPVKTFIKCHICYKKKFSGDSICVCVCVTRVKVDLLDLWDLLWVPHFTDKMCWPLGFVFAKDITCLLFRVRTGLRARRERLGFREDQWVHLRIQSWWKYLCMMLNICDKSWSLQGRPGLNGAKGLKGDSGSGSGYAYPVSYCRSLTLSFASFVLWLLLWSLFYRVLPVHLAPRDHQELLVPSTESVWVDLIWKHLRMIFGESRTSLTNVNGCGFRGMRTSGGIFQVRHLYWFLFSLTCSVQEK